MSELINFTISMAQNFYNIQNRHLLEAIFLALHPIEELFIAHADVFLMHNQVIVYRELLLLGDLPTITQEDRVMDCGWRGCDDLPCQAGGDGCQAD